MLPIFRQLADICSRNTAKSFQLRGINAPVAKSALRTWMNDHTDITLFAIGIADQPADLFVMYKTNLLKGSRQIIGSFIYMVSIFSLKIAKSDMLIDD